MVQMLSHVVKKGDPGWPNNPTIDYEQFMKIGENGSPANGYTVHLFNHFASHMDGPNHFNPNGVQLYQVPDEKFVYLSPLVVDVDVDEDDYLISLEDIRPYAKSMEHCDALLFRTHFTRYRIEDQHRYAHHGPGLSPQLCEHLVKSFPNIKAAALDFISLASYQHDEEGVLSHQWMLGNFYENYILIIEDLNFEKIKPETLKMVVALPLRISGIDSAPCTVMALQDDDLGLGV